MIVAATLLGCAAQGLTLEPSTPLASYGRQAWGMENGLPQNTVQALAQTRDGFVWLGTEVGLVRFDGVGFQVFDRNSSPALPGNDVRCLLAAKDGSLWIGTSDGLARWKDGALTAFSTKDGLPGNGIRSIVQSSNGVVWAWTVQGLARFEEGRFIDSTAATKFPAGAISAVTSDGQREIWVTAGEDLSIYREGRWEHAHMAPPIAGGSVDFVQALRGMSAIASKTTALVLHGGDLAARLGVGSELPGTRIQALFFDRKGSLWIGTNAGLARWTDGKAQRLPVTDPLARASVLALMEDREGNIWVGTETDGLHILRDQRFRTLDARDGLSSDATTTAVEDNAGTLWVGTGGGGLNAIDKGPAGTGTSAVKIYSVRNGLTSDVILSLAAAPNGDMWAGTPDGLNRIHAGAITSFTSADGLPDDFIRSLLVDADGSLWIGTRRGLTHWLNAGAPASNATMETLTHANGLGSDLVGAMARDAHGDLWIATFAGLSRLHGGKIENYTTANGLSSNVVTALLPRRNGTLLIGTQDHGWNLWDGQRITAAGEGFNGQRQAAVHAILEDETGHLWFATGNGIARGDCPETLAPRIGVEPGGCSRWMEFGPADGLRSRETATNSHPSAWRSRDGLLWFATPKGLVEVDAAHFPVNAVPPGVALERFAIDDIPQALHAADSVMQIPAGHVHFEFDYAGLSFVAPQKVRYRYMLENFDPGWTEAGARRTAYYTNIPAGHYTFRVQASNNDGVWNTEGAALEFKLRPHFFQTLWFYALLVLAFVGLVLLVQRLRLKRAEREFNAVLGERNRIAREIHDTLAQGYVGISVQLEVLAELLRLSKVDAAAKHLDLTRGYVREGLADARQSIWALRSQDSGETTLPVKLRRMVESEGNHGLESSFSIFGAYRPLPPGTEREILRIAQEAIHNVRKHARAHTLLVQLEYGSQEIALDVRDDGQGFAPGEAPAAGHYGLTGMRERATTIGGKLEITSEPGGGTTVRLCVSVRKEASAQMKEQL
ncbi:MAG TPA: two-component regulator propeller domain-containing protein [Terracidiphilus sp.]|nr:two-component regulator propeller domain-containing protein [Terracidiphilus sp.]